jgi:hypothetical protein
MASHAYGSSTGEEEPLTAKQQQYDLPNELPWIGARSEQGLAPWVSGHETCSAAEVDAQSTAHHGPQTHGASLRLCLVSCLAAKSGILKIPAWIARLIALKSLGSVKMDAVSATVARRSALIAEVVARWRRLWTNEDDSQNSSQRHLGLPGEVQLVRPHHKSTSASPEGLS